MIPAATAITRMACLAGMSVHKARWPDDEASVQNHRQAFGTASMPIGARRLYCQLYANEAAIRQQSNRFVTTQHPNYNSQGCSRS